MIGEQWNTLVAKPSERELDAAMAAVRVRALEHWKRRVWRGRALQVAGYVAVALIFGYAGWNAAGLRAMNGDALDGTSTAWPDGTVRAMKVPSTETALSDGVRRYRITAWTEIEGVQVLAGESFIESAHPMTLQLSASFETAVLSGMLSIVPGGSTTSYNGFLSLRRKVTVSPRGLAVYEDGRAGVSLSADSGTAALFTLFPDIPGYRPILRIEGPWAAPPGRRLHWQTVGADTRFANAAGWLVSNITAYPPLTVRFRWGRGESRSLVIPSLRTRHTLLRGHSAGMLVYVWAEEASGISVSGQRQPRDRYVCIGVRSLALRAGQPPRQAYDCSDPAQHLFRLGIPGMEKLTAEIIP